MYRADEITSLHLLMRVPRLTRISKSQTINTVQAHSEVARLTGRVAIAKLGLPTSSITIERLRAQIKAGKRTCLILAVKLTNGHAGYESELESIRIGPPTDEIIKHAPPYYRSFSYAAGLWFIVRNPFELCDLNVFRLASNQHPMVEVLKGSRTPAMLVSRSNP